MTKGYVFKAGTQTAISKEADGKNLPSPKIGPWQAVRTVDDVNAPGLIGFDPEAFDSQGYQVWGAKPNLLDDQDVLGNDNILKD